MHKHFDLTGKTALVTGGGGILGKGFCKVLAEYGASVVLVDITIERAKKACEDILQNVPGAQIMPLACDVADKDSVTSMVNSAVRQFSSIDVLLNNAASKADDLNAFFAPFESYDLDLWRKVMSINIDGAFLVAQAVGGQMVKQGNGGSIINTSSIYGVLAPDQRIYEGSEYMGVAINTPAVYSASKAALIGLSNYLATYWAEANIRVNVLSPGGVESGQNETFKKKYSARIPLGRMGRDDELHGAILFLASDASSYFTGQNVMVDGGLSVW
ncbi:MULTISPECIES: SDR family oxidoreductase [Thalassospira]|uniref:Short-chain dehydrogenase n=2 Tax=Thalassospira tepidiphila TaxID=393657 RepID=A0A853L3P2_9PROT|nr:MULTISPECIES: SDR family oxidoreductase [Thalassospira]MBO6577944.1 SDR family oxidoreductase [Thalassospira sp.]MBO6817246.1 SDR family oxidoreductase [Thalassospira sp.]NJB73909.1 NAD(P)-dependent dehydrogenase (short-subunit alcohol dehydrogenase family) [Thalassospira tepidiphila]OAZ11928.1 short-chain dehydrogenase [Thalassospira tepidiphila MCCC 1A03514]